MSASSKITRPDHELRLKLARIERLDQEFRLELARFDCAAIRLAYGPQDEELSIKRPFAPRQLPMGRVNQLLLEGEHYTKGCLG